MGAGSRGARVIAKPCHICTSPSDLLSLGMFVLVRKVVASHWSGQRPLGNLAGGKTGHGQESIFEGN
jgi:hypothetical protein